MKFNKLFEQIIEETKTSFSDLILQFAQYYFKAKKQIQRANIYSQKTKRLFSNGSLKESDDKKSIDFSDLMEDAINRAQKCTAKLNLIKERITELAYGSETVELYYEDENSKTLVLQLLEDSEEIITTINALQPIGETLKVLRNEVFSLIDSHKITDTDDK
jgi:hypothetical protein